jgi:hypothetical protein
VCARRFRISTRDTGAMALGQITHTRRPRVVLPLSRPEHSLQREAGLCLVLEPRHCGEVAAPRRAINREPQRTSQSRQRSTQTPCKRGNTVLGPTARSRAAGAERHGPSAPGRQRSRWRSSGTQARAEPRHGRSCRRRPGPPTQVTGRIGLQVWIWSPEVPANRAIICIGDP